MSSLAPQQMRLLAAALVRLRGETLGHIAKATGIRTANLSVWLRGKEQVISEKRLTKLLHYLGVEGGRLRTDMLHLWQDNGALDDCRMVLAAFLEPDKSSLYRDEEPGLVKTRFLLAGETLIRVQIEPGVTVASDLTDVFATLWRLTVDVPLAGITTNSREAAHNELMNLAVDIEQLTMNGQNAVYVDVFDEYKERLKNELYQVIKQKFGAELLALVEQGVANVEDEGLLEGALYQLSEEHGWQQLGDTLRAAFKTGMTPDEIASVLDEHLRKGGKTTRKQDAT